MNIFLSTFKYLSIILLVTVNVLAYRQAYNYTHFQKQLDKESISANDVALTQSIRTLFQNVSISKPTNQVVPKKSYETIHVAGNDNLEGWLINVKNHKGVILLFHGYASCKSNLLNYSDQFNEWGYSTILMDFTGHGGSEGIQTTIGFNESADVLATYEFVKDCFPKDEIILFGSSMGAVSIMKSINDYCIEPDRIIIQCPFSTMVANLRNRIETMKAPTFPLAEVLTLYGGIANGFNPFNHKPIEYAKNIDIPTLLLHGKKDMSVTVDEIKDIFKNIPGYKQLVLLENSAHENYLNKDSKDWATNVLAFLN